jgi:iron complex outermembrane recepter protein
MIRLIRIISCICVFLLGAVLSFGQSGAIEGRVIDSETGVALVAATVLVEGETIGTTTDTDGYYILAELDTGSYLIEVTYLGYEKQTRLAVLSEQKTHTLDFGLLPLFTQLSEVVVTASEQDFLNEPMPMTQISSQQIERLSATNTAELMEDIAGVSVARAGNWGSKPYLQGMTDSRVVMFIDGIKTTQACPMGMDACSATIEPDMISSMDVQVGPGSAQFGSGNMGGVINVNTIGSEYLYLDKFKTDVDIASRYKSVSNSITSVVSVKGGNRVFDFVASAGGGWYDNYKIPDPDKYSVFPKNEIPHSGYNSKWLLLNARYRPTSKQQISLISQLYRADSIGWPSRLEETYTVIPKEQRDMLALKYEFEPNGTHFKKLEANVSVQPMNHDMVNYTPGNLRFVGLSQTNNYQATVKTNFTFWRNHFFTAGMDGFIWKMYAERKTVTDTTETPYEPILNNGVMYESGLYILDRFVYNDKLTIDAGMRLNYVLSDALPLEGGMLNDDLKDEQLVWTGNIAAVYKINKHLSVFGSLVKGYNAATPVDRFISSPLLDGFYHYGNPALKPEIIFSKRIGVRGMHNKWSWSVEYFHNKLNNLIERRVDTTLTSPIPGLRGVKQAQNIANAVITGGSVYAAYYATPSLQISLTASYLYGKAKDNSPLPNIAPFELSPTVKYENATKNFWITLRADIATEQKRYAPEYGELYTPGYVVFDLTGGWKVSDWLELSGGFQNLTNRYYRKHLNQVQLPEPGMNFFTSVKFRLSRIGKSNDTPKLKDAKLVTLEIKGMACQFCARTVRDRSEALPDVIQSIVYLQDGRAEVIVGKHVSLEKLIEAIHRAGFNAKVISVVAYER